MESTYDLLDRHIDRLLSGCDGGAGFDQPGIGLSFFPLFETSALVSSQLMAVEPSPEFRALAARRARNLYLARLSQRDSRPGSLFIWWQRRWVTAMATSVVVCLAGLGMLAASVNALPTGFFYPVKTATEEAHLMLVSSPVDRAELQLEYASRRLDEMASMAGKGDVQTSLLLAGETASLVGQVCASSLFGIPATDAGLAGLNMYINATSASPVETLNEERASVLALMQRALDSAPSELQPDIRSFMDEVGRDFDTTITLLESTTSGR